MKIAVTRTDFQEAVNIVKDGVGGDNLAIIRNVKLETSGDDKLILTATNLDTTISTEVKCQIKEPGATTVPAKFFASAIGALTAEIVEFKSDEKGGGKAVLTGGDATYKIVTLPADEFPKSAKVTGKTVVFTQQELKEMIRKTSYAASQDGTRRALNGILFKGDGDSVSAVGVDGRRLASITLQKPGCGEFEVIIPNLAIKFIQKLVAKDGDVKVTFSQGNSAYFESEWWKLQVKLVDEKYPNYKQVIPASMATKIPVDRNLFVDSVKQVSLSTANECPQVNLKIAKGSITMSSTNQEVSDAKVMFPVKYDGDEIDVALAPGYLLDVLNSIDSDEVSFNINDGHSPITITCDDREKVDFVSVIMPLRVG